MKFCPKCGSLLRTQRKGGSLLYSCLKCGYEEISEKSHATIQNRREATRTGQPMIVESVDEGKASFSKTKVVCPKCGNGEAYWWMQQTRAADEATTRFFRCTKCGHVWREYD